MNFLAIRVSVVVLLLQVAGVRCQLLSTQSHLGRLVQSITSPLIISSSSGRPGGSPFAPIAAPSSSYDQDEQDAAPLHYPESNGEADSPRVQQAQPQDFRQQEELRNAYAAASLQQAPSRGIPQRYRGNEEGAEPSNRRPAEEAYQMGAYLGPTIDDKEIQGAFNSKDDERDEDDGPAGYEGPPGGGRSRLAADASYGASRPSYGQQDSYMGPASYGNGQGGAYNNAQDGNDDDSSSADEDDAPPKRGAYRRPASLNQAASHQFEGRSRQRAANGDAGRGRRQQQLVAAANGYAPYGQPAGGPIDLSGIVAAANGAGYDVYNGDGSYPGSGYWQQQQQPRQRAAASANDPYNQQQQWGAGNGYGPYGGGGNDGRRPAKSQSDPDDDDGDDMA